MKIDTWQDGVILQPGNLGAAVTVMIKSAKEGQQQIKKGPVHSSPMYSGKIQARGLRSITRNLQLAMSPARPC
jgi:hypothetical protein